MAASAALQPPGVRRGTRRRGDGPAWRVGLRAPAQVTPPAKRRRFAPWELAGGEPGRPGVNRLNGVESRGKVSTLIEPGEGLTIDTPGGGAWGPPSEGIHHPYREEPT